MEPLPSVETRADVAQPKGPISSLIYDVGMNNGDDTAYYLRNGFDVVAIEAHPVLVEHARARFAREISDGRVTVLDVGIAEGDGEATFWICEDNSVWSSFDRSIASRGRSQPRAVSVHLRPFADILAEYGVPYYCKMDIEGNEHLCVAAMTAQSRPAFISTELTERSLLDELSGLGYDRANGLLRGRLMDRGWYFRRGSSGPLPDRTAGPWLTLEEIRRQCDWARENLLAGDWWDLHATGVATSATAAPTLE